MQRINLKRKWKGWHLDEIPEASDLYSLYWRRGMHLCQIGDIYDVATCTVGRWFRDYGIPRRQTGEAHQLNWAVSAEHRAVILARLRQKHCQGRWTQWKAMM